MSRRTFGAPRALDRKPGMSDRQCKRWQARYRCPSADEHPVNPASKDGQPYPAMHAAHDLKTGRPLGTFMTKGDADVYLTEVRAAILKGTHVCPVRQQAEVKASGPARATFREYAEKWYARRTNPGAAKPLSMRTAGEYRRNLDELCETFGDLPLASITRQLVRTWWEDTLPTKYPQGRPTGNAHVYSLLRTVLNDAVEREVLETNPCRIKGAGQTKRKKDIRPATPGEVYAIAEDERMPDRFRLAVHVAAMCAQRFGEVFELRRRDVAADGSTITVARGMTYKGKVWRVGEPKADSAGIVDVPPHLRQPLLDHIQEHAQPGADGLLFWQPTHYTGEVGGCHQGPNGGNCGHVGCAGGHYYSQGFDKYWRPAKAAAGRPDLSFHELRHTGNTLFGQVPGVSLADQMKRLRHSTPAAAIRYQHAVDGRAAQLAAGLSELPALRLVLGERATG